jgi:hypothetical protein
MDMYKIPKIKPFFYTKHKLSKVQSCYVIRFPILKTANFLRSWLPFFINRYINFEDKEVSAVFIFLALLFIVPHLY